MAVFPGIFFFLFKMSSYGWVCIGSGLYHYIANLLWLDDVNKLRMDPIALQCINSNFPAVD